MQRCIETRRDTRTHEWVCYAPGVPGPRIHLAHDWLVGLRGGEWVLDALARLYGPTTLYTLVNDGRFLTDAIAACRVITSPLQRIPGASGRLRRWCFPIMPWAVERLRVRGPEHPDGCDLLISTSSAVMKAIIPPTRPDGEPIPHLCYCHSPARYAWDQLEDYRHGALGGLRAAGLRMIRRRFQRWDRAVCSRVTRFLANSQHTAKRIERCWEREAVVAPPPVRTTFFTPDPAVPREDWHLLVGALEPYKRVDLAIRACTARRARLRIAGSGSQRGALERLARRTMREHGAPPGTIEFLGRVDDASLRDLYRRARALIQPQMEDFGIIAVEAQACGCPVIAYAAGGALETVAEECGVFFESQTVEALGGALRQFEARSWESAACRQSAERFSESVFDQRLTEQVMALCHHA